ncbi:MAG TPA: L-glutamate gamma-semialdehyde dehydrogenase [Chthoniobacterales bacterium]|jgi:RHH-type proline utilization regulon transcriptional repressor/proline dehydrogenase/delta 1-pyrroline-5-carboxylate dehydrogenase|nr:L-glutamate gamma-semialdehyde dehydrogenase [Chthoniobacterales bacterium]
MSSLQQEIEQRGLQMLDLVDQNPESIFSKAGFYQRMMAFSMRDEHFKVQMFRFVDVLASLRRPADIVRHLNEYFADMRNGSVPFLQTGIRAARIFPWLTAPILRWNVSGMARQFIAGRDPDDVMKTLRRRRAEKIGFTVDLLGEAVVSEEETNEYAARCLALVEGLSEQTRGWRDPLGKNSELFPVVNVSVKISALYSQMNPADPADAIAHLGPKLRPILRRARELGAFINFDMESYAHKNTTLELFRTLFSEPEFREWPHAGIVIQAYLRDAEKDLRDLIEWGRQRGTRFTVRLVKGAYWDYEKIKAAQNGWRVPVFLQKPESDANFEICTRILLENEGIASSAFGSHNIRSIAHAQAYAQELGIDKSRMEFQLLYGMAGPIKRALVEMGYRVREYCPVGELLPGMSYLVRRLLENTSNEGFLKAKFSDKAGPEQLLRDPRSLIRNSARPGSAIPATTSQSRNGQSLDTPPGDTYENSPLVNFVHRSSQEKMQAALVEMRGRLGNKYPLVIDGQKVWTDNLINSINPTSPDKVVGAVAEAKIEHAEQAVTAAKKAFEHWCRVSVDHRAELLERVATIMDRRRFELSALEVYEVGKPWAEADGDIREAIDFLLFYAQQMRLRGLPRLTQHVPGEESYQHYWPRGVALVIAPWNFPVAILTGMVSAALVTGNTVIMKPAEQSAVCGALLMEMFEEAGVPAGVLNFLPGKGSVIGQHLVDHKDVHMIAFTGSREVGLRIWKSAGETREGQLELKRVVCEMGGKNAVIVDSDADLDEAIVDTVYSAFGYQGQKCSACSRLIVLEENYERVVKRLVEAAASLRVGNPETPGITVGPVIDETAYRRIIEIVEAGKSEATLAYQGKAPSEGFFIPPTIFTGVKPHTRLAREEIFGPVLSVLKVRDLDEAIRVANDTDYALTAGFFSRSPANIERVKAELVAGNVYINRSCTGAVVGRHPFGGFKMSGGGTKAGGGDYLLQFVVPRVVTENIMRHGFAPDTTPEFRQAFGAATVNHS